VQADDNSALYPAIYTCGALVHAVSMNAASLLFAEAGMRASQTLL